MSLIPGAFLTVGRGHRRDWSERASEAKKSLRPWILPLKPTVLLCKVDYSSFPTKEAEGREGEGREGIEEGLGGGGEEGRVSDLLGLTLRQGNRPERRSEGA